MMSAVSVNPGPIVWLTACVHGDEVCGIVIIQEVFKKIRQRLLCGSIHAFPLMNPIGFESASRNITMSREDLNRSFPGDPTGSLGKRIAHLIFSQIMATRPSLVLDLHNDWAKSIPYALIDRNPGSDYKNAYEKTIEFAKQTGFACIIDRDELSSTLSCNLLLNDVPALTLELGEPKVVNEINVKHGLGAIWNVLAHLGMTAPLQERISFPLPPTYGSGQLLGYAERPVSSRSGIIRFMAKPGDALIKGQAFARIVNAFGKHLDTVRAVEDALVLGYSDSSAVFPGMPIMAFGVQLG